MAIRKRRAIKDDMTQAMPSDFGAFYPMGHVVVAFPGCASARQVRKDLLAGGCDARDVLHYSAKAAARSLRNNLENIGFMARIGNTDTVLRKQAKLADEGCDFLLLHASTRKAVDRAINVVRRSPFRVAQKFHRFALEDLQSDVRCRPRLVASAGGPMTCFFD